LDEDYKLKTWSDIQEFIQLEGLTDDGMTEEKWKYVRNFASKLDAAERGKMNLYYLEKIKDPEYRARLIDTQISKMEVYKDPEYIENLRNNQKKRMGL